MKFWNKNWILFTSILVCSSQKPRMSILFPWVPSLITHKLNSLIIQFPHYTKRILHQSTLQLHHRHNLSCIQMPLLPHYHVFVGYFFTVVCYFVVALSLMFKLLFPFHFFFGIIELDKNKNETSFPLFSRICTSFACEL